MKIKRAFILLLAVLCLFAAAVWADSGIRVSVDGRYISFTDAEPIIYDGRTMVPVRAVFDALGAEVDFNSKGVIIGKKGNNTVEMCLGNKYIISNGIPSAMDTVPIVINSRALVPARYIAESFGYSVSWDSQSKTVSINSRGYAPAPAPQTNGKDVRLHFIDVGQGDCTLIEDNGHYMLIDAGETEYGSTVVSYIKNMGISCLDYVIASHPHSDHIGGLDDVINTFDVKNVIITSEEAVTASFENLLDALEKSNADIIEAMPGKSYTLGLSSFKILAPGKLDDDSNNNSIAIRLSYKQSSALLCADAEKEEELYIARSGENIASDLLKVNHHGSPGSSCEEFLYKVQPKYAVISVGKDNSYGHPSMNVLSALNAVGAKIYRTDLNGNVVASLTGSSVSVSTEKNDTDKRTEKMLQNAVLNTNSKKVHLPECESVSKMSAKNKKIFSGSVEELIEMGYSACGYCQPF